MAERAPVVVFAYRRPAHLSRLLASLAACEGFAQTPVTVYLDAPAGEADRADVAAVRALPALAAHPNVTPVLRERHLGLRASVIAGVGEACARHGRVIVLEDDLVLSPAALAFFNAGLDTYADEPRLWSLCGYMVDAPALRGRTAAFALPLAHPWGWATWARAWRRFDPAARPDPALLASRSFRTAFDAFGLRDFTAMLALAQEGRIESWFIHWYFALFRAGGLSLFPPVSLVRNTGIGGAGATHASRWNPYRRLAREAPLAGTPCAMPDDLAVDHPALDAMIASRDARLQRWLSRLGGARRRLRGASR